MGEKQEDQSAENSFLKRVYHTRLVQTLALYIPVAWFLNEFIAYATESFGLPPWIAGVAMALFIASIPVVAFLAWVFQITESGVKTEVVSWKGGLSITIAFSLLFGVSFVLYSNLEINRVATSRTSTETLLSSRPYQLEEVYENSIAVLPFVDLGGGDGEDYLGDGIPEEIRHVLTNVQGLRVASRLSSVMFGDEIESIQDIGRELGVAAVLEGTVQVSGRLLRVTVQLTDVEEGYQIWSERYDRKMTNIFDIQDDIARNIVETLQLSLVDSSDNLVSERHPEDIRAYELYLKGRYHAANYDEPELRTAIAYFEEALRIEPTYALAYAGLADAYGSLDYFGHVLPISIQAEIRSSVNQALALDATLADTHFSSARLLFNSEREPEAAEEAFRLALQLDPADAWKHGLYAIFLSTQGRGQEAVYEASISRQLDQLSVRENLTPGWVAFFSRDFEQALAIGNSALELNPGFVNTLELISYSQYQMGAVDEAIALLQGANALADFPLVQGNLGFMYGTTGREAEAREILERLLARSRQEYIPASSIATIYIGLGELEEASNWMDRAIANREGNLSILNVVAFDQIRQHPDFPDWLAQIGLPQID
jgi:TolB-like protein/Tfp pilus assembly protein PilF